MQGTEEIKKGSCFQRKVSSIGWLFRTTLLNAHFYTFIHCMFSQDAMQSFHLFTFFKSHESQENQARLIIPTCIQRVNPTSQPCFKHPQPSNILQKYQGQERQSQRVYEVEQLFLARLHFFPKKLVKMSQIPSKVIISEEIKRMLHTCTHVGRK